MKIIAWDLSSRQGSMAFVSGGRLLAQHMWPNDRRNSAPFFTSLEKIVRQYGSPSVIVVGLGPGSYTGTRIAISAAIGLQLTSSARLAGLPSVCAVSEEGDYTVIGDAKRSSFFLASVSRSRIAGEIELLSQSAMTEHLSRTETPIYTSDDLPIFSRAQLAFPRAELLCRLDHEHAHVPPLEPIYLRPPHITMPRASAP